MNQSKPPSIDSLPEAASLPGRVRAHDDLKRHEAQVLRETGFTLKEIAKQPKIGVRTVQRIVEEPPVADLKASPQSGPARPVGRPRVAAAFEEEARGILDAEPSLPTVEVLRRLRLKGYAASASLAAWLPRFPPVSPTVSRTHLNVARRFRYRSARVRTRVGWWITGSRGAVTGTPCQGAAPGYA